MGGKCFPQFWLYELRSPARRCSENDITIHTELRQLNIDDAY